MRKNLTICGFLCLLFLAGCGKSQDAANVSEQTEQTAQAEQAKHEESADVAVAGEHREELLRYAVDNLNRLEEFETADAIRQITQQLNPQNKKKTPEKQADTLLATWPEPEMLRQIVNRLNQWIRTRRAPADWKPDAMLSGLPKELAGLPQLKDLGEMEFSRFDGFVMQEAVLTRDAARWAKGDAVGELEQAKNLFDWTVCNIQLDFYGPGRIPLFPWETLLFGRGTADERAWVFVMLCRQLGIEAGVIEAGEASHARCLAAVLSEGQVYLFDPLLGLPIPAKNGVSRDSAGRLTIQPATLEQSAKDEKVFGALSADPKHAYSLKASELRAATVLLEASPVYLSRRMKLLESCLAGSQKMVLSAAPSIAAEHWKAAPGVKNVKLWLHPFETLHRRSHLNPQEVQMRLGALLPFYAQLTAPLSRGRKLHIAGKLTGDDGAIHYYQLARPSQEELASSSAHPLEKMLNLRAKQDASYWLGLISLQRENYPSAIDYFTKRTLLFDPKGPWTNGAKYNLARTFEASGDAEKATLQYQNNDGSPGYLGDLLRAKWIKGGK